MCSTAPLANEQVFKHMMDLRMQQQMQAQAQQEELLTSGRRRASNGESEGSENLSNEDVKPLDFSSRKNSPASSPANSPTPPTAVSSAGTPPLKLTPQAASTPAAAWPPALLRNPLTLMNSSSEPAPTPSPPAPQHSYYPPRHFPPTPATEPSFAAAFALMASSPAASATERDTKMAEIQRVLRLQQALQQKQQEQEQQQQEQQQQQHRPQQRQSRKRRSSPPPMPPPCLTMAPMAAAAAAAARLAEEQTLAQAHQPTELDKLNQESLTEFARFREQELRKNAMSDAAKRRRREPSQQVQPTLPPAAEESNSHSDRSNASSPATADDSGIGIPAHPKAPKGVAKKATGGGVGKDETYWERRRKNNEAAKRSRDARKAKETEAHIRASFLEKENWQLKREVARLKAENEQVKALIFSSAAASGESSEAIARRIAAAAI